MADDFSEFAGRPIVRRKLADDVFERLRDMIASGKLRPGDALPSERVLMEQLQVGRPAVREALQQLHTLGLITISHGERSRVNALDPNVALRHVDDIATLLLSAEPQNLENLKEVRKLFEVGVVRTAAQRVAPADIADLRALVEAQHAQMGNPEAFIGADIAFHRRIATVVGNPLIVAISEALLKWLFNYHTSLLHWSGHETVTLMEHAKIVDALATADPDGAATIMTVHLDRSDEFYRHHPEKGRP